jgi:hypothetical protein
MYGWAVSHSPSRTELTNYPFPDKFCVILDLLLYSLCPASSLQPTYEPLLQLLYLHSSSSSAAITTPCCHLLATLTDESQVMAHRVRRVRRMLIKGKTPAARKRMGMVLRKYKDLRPDLVTWVRRKKEIIENVAHKTFIIIFPFSEH